MSDIKGRPISISSLDLWFHSGAILAGVSGDWPCQMLLRSPARQCLFGCLLKNSSWGLLWESKLGLTCTVKPCCRSYRRLCWSMWETTFVVTMCSSFLHRMLTRDIGLYLDARLVYPFLKSGQTYAVLQSLGTLPVSIEGRLVYCLLKLEQCLEGQAVSAGQVLQPCEDSGPWMNVNP